MTEKKSVIEGGFSADWLFRGALSRIGDTVDKLTGRRWTPSSSLATSELVERVKRLIDAEAKQVPGKGTIVPHNIKLKVQWDKFSTDSDDALKMLEHELLTAAGDHINDNLYYTNSPLKISVKPDYFTEGVKLLVSFDDVIDDDHEAQLNVTMPSINLAPGTLAAGSKAKATESNIFIARFELKGSRRDRRIVFPAGGRISVGRTSANDLAIEDASVSKIHASIVFGREGLSVADTGSTNGTFINDERIPYGKAVTVADGDKVKFGTVEVVFERLIQEPKADEALPDDTIKVGEMEFMSRPSSPGVPVDEMPEKTVEIDQPVGSQETKNDRPDGVEK